MWTGCSREPAAFIYAIERSCINKVASRTHPANESLQVWVIGVV
jgi:hypothetical protein